jgi:hypothetical protein
MSQVIVVKNMFQKFFLYGILVISLGICSCNKETIITNGDYKTLGSSAHHLLAASPYPAMQIQIDYMPGFAPDTSGINTMVNFLNTYLHKPSGIQVFIQPIKASGQPVLSVTDIINIEKNSRGVFTRNNIIAVFILITDGDYSLSNIFAISYWNTSFCIFGKAIRDNSGNVGQVSTNTLLTTILEHEFGHLMGLVDQGTPMLQDHNDPFHGAHCNNSNCLMHYDVESTSGGSNSGMPVFDANCIADLKANGGK